LFGFLSEWYRLRLSSGSWPTDRSRGGRQRCSSILGQGRQFIAPQSAALVSSSCCWRPIRGRKPRRPSGDEVRAEPNGPLDNRYMPKRRQRFPGVCRRAGVLKFRYHLRVLPPTVGCNGRARGMSAFRLRFGGCSKRLAECSLRLFCSGTSRDVGCLPNRRSSSPCRREKGSGKGFSRGDHDWGVKQMELAVRADCREAS
jgi:hypothetical protein